MLTADFDFVVELNERFVNRALSAAFYTTILSDPRTGIERGFEYSIRLNDPPTVDTFSQNTIRILFYPNVRVKKFGFTFEFDIKAYVDASPTYDIDSRKLKLKLKQATVEDIRIGDKHGWFKIFSWRVKLPRFIINFFNTILAVVINSGVLAEIETIDVSPILYSLDLPYMPAEPASQLTIGLGNIKSLSQSVLAVCVNFLGYDGGNIEQLTDFSEDLDFCSGVSEDAMHRVFDFWWRKTNHPKTVTSTGSSDIPVVDDLLNSVAGIFDLATQLATMGFVEADVTVDRAWIDYGATVKFRKPSFNLLDGNKIELTDCGLQIHAWATPKITFTVSVEADTSGPIPDDWTPWEDDQTIYRQTSTCTICTLSIDLDVTIDLARAKVYLDDQNRLMAKVEDVDVTIDLGWSLPQYVLNLIVNWIIDLVIEKIPPIVLSPAVITKDIPGTGLTLNIDIDKLTTNDDEAIVGASLSLEQIGETVRPVPKFIVDTRQSYGLLATAPRATSVVSATPATSTEGTDALPKGVIHRSDCILVNDILERNKAGVYVLADALRDGHKPCPECLPEYQPG